MKCALTLLQKAISCRRNTFAQRARSILRNSCPQNLGALPRKNLRWSPLFCKVTGCRPVILLKQLTTKCYFDNDVTLGIIRNFHLIIQNPTSQNNCF